MKTYTKEEIGQYNEYCIAGYGKPKKPDEYYSKEEVELHLKEGIALLLEAMKEMSKDEK